MLRTREVSTLVVYEGEFVEGEAEYRLQNDFDPDENGCSIRLTIDGWLSKRDVNELRALLSMIVKEKPAD